MSISVDADVWAWLHEHGLVVARAGGAGGKAVGKGAGRLPLPAHVSAGLLSGEIFAKLLNGIFAKHGLKQSVKLVPGDDHYSTWESVSHGLHRLSVELDEDTIKALASGDVGLVTELLGELHQVYRHWVATEAKRRRRRQVERRAQPQQGGGGGGGYSRALAGGSKSSAPEASEISSVMEPTPREVPTSISASVDPTPRDVQRSEAVSVDPTPREVKSERRQDTGRTPTNAPEERRGDVEDEPHVGRGGMQVAMTRTEEPRGSVETIEPTDSRSANQYVAPPVVAPSSQRNVGHDAPEYDLKENRQMYGVAPQQLVTAPRAPVQEKPSLNVEMLLMNVSMESEIERAATAPELMALSMLHHLRISPSQARSLLVEDARRLARAFGDSNEKHASYLTRWLRSLSYYCGALVELLLVHPEHIAFVLNSLGHGMRAASPAVAEWACRILAIICGGLQNARLGGFAYNWLLESSALKDVGSLLATCPAAQSSVAAMVFNCSGQQLLPVLAQNLKQASRGEQEYLGTVHLLLCSFLKQTEMIQVCATQGVFSHFLARCVQRLGDDRSTPGTQQAAALLASELWLVCVEHKGTQQASSPEGPGELLAALKRATQNGRSPTLCLVAFSCLSRLLGTLCSRCDVENTPAVYRTFVYALVETEDSAVRDFATRNLMGLMEQHIGMPVGILVEPMMKKIQVAPSSLLAVIDIELYLTIAKHPRCTARHAEMLAQVLGRACVENVEFGRSATLPFLAILHRFAEDDVILSFFERFMQITLSRLIQKGVSKAQTTQTLEVLAKVACLRKRELESMMRRMLGDICKAYLMNYEALHPNLRALLELWPSEEAAVDEWGRAQFMPERPPSQPERDAMVDDDASSMVMRSISPSLHSEAPKTPAMYANPDRYDTRSNEQQREPMPTSPSGNLDEDDESQFLSPRDSVRTDGHVQELVQETEHLRDELEKAKERHQESLEEAEKLRQQLDDARRIHEKVEEEVSNLQTQRENILRQQGAKRGAPGSQQERDKTDKTKASETDAEMVTALVKAFAEPLQVVLQMPLQTKKARGAPVANAVDTLEQLFGELDLLPGKLTKKTISEAVRVVVPHSRDAALTLDVFLSVLPKLANKAFAPQDATPFRDFGVAVPTKKDPPAMRQTQALLQHLTKVAQSGKLSSVPSLKAAFKGALRRWVLRYARSVLEDLNGRLNKGEDLPERDIPDGFEILFRVPPPVYSVPEGMPVSSGEKFSVEILDDILFRAVGVHFLEPLVAAKGPVAIAAVRGHEDLSVLDIEPQVVLQPDHQQSPRQRGELQGGSRRQSGNSNRVAPSNATEPRNLHRDSIQRRQGRPRRQERQQESPQRQQARDRSRERNTNEADQTSPRPQRNRVPAPRLQQSSSPPPPQRRDVSPPQRRDVSPTSRQPTSRRQNPSPSPVPRRNASNQRPVPQSSVANSTPNVVPPVNAAPNPAALAPGRRDRQLQRLSSAVNSGKERQEAIQSVLQSPEVQAIFKSASSGTRRTFDFFANWKGGNDGSMLLAGFFLLGDCFGILDKNALKVIHRQVGGQGLRGEQFSEALYCCAVRFVEIKVAGSQMPLSEEKQLWVSALRALSTHMLLFDTQALRRQLDVFRRKGDVLQQFQPELSTLQEETTPRVPEILPPTVSHAPEGQLSDEEASRTGVTKQQDSVDLDSTAPRGAVDATDFRSEQHQDPIAEKNVSEVVVEPQTTGDEILDISRNEGETSDVTLQPRDTRTEEDLTEQTLIPGENAVTTSATDEPTVTEDPSSENPPVEPTEPVVVEEPTATDEEKQLPDDVQKENEPPVTSEDKPPENQEVVPETSEEKSPESQESKPPETSEEKLPENQETAPPETSEEKPLENQESVPPETSEEKPPENQESAPPETSEEKPPENQEPLPDTTADGTNPVDQ